MHFRKARVCTYTIVKKLYCDALIQFQIRLETWIKPIFKFGGRVIRTVHFWEKQQKCPLRPKNVTIGKDLSVQCGLTDIGLAQFY